MEKSKLPFYYRNWFWIVLFLLEPATYYITTIAAVVLMLASGKEVQTKNKNEDTIKSFADSLTFTLDEANSDKSASYYIYTATAENTTQLNFEYLSLNFKLIDDQGTTVDTQPIYENNWAANEKRNLEFTTDKTFSNIQITVNDYSLED